MLQCTIRDASVAARGVCLRLRRRGRGVTECCAVATHAINQLAERATTLASRRRSSGFYRSREATRCFLMSRNFPCVASRHRTSCGGKMKKVRKFNAAVALGSLTAAVALLAGAPAASAQTAPGGGSFPGSFLVPGTNTSIKIGGYAKIVGIYDIKGVPAAAANVGNPDVEVPAAIPLSGSGAAGAHGALRFHARQSNINLDSRTPTAYGDL